MDPLLYNIKTDSGRSQSTGPKENIKTQSGEPPTGMEESDSLKTWHYIAFAGVFGIGWLSWRDYEKAGTWWWDRLQANIQVFLHEWEPKRLTETQKKAVKAAYDTNPSLLLPDFMTKNANE